MTSFLNTLSSIATYLFSMLSAIFEIVMDNPILLFALALTFLSEIIERAKKFLGK